MPFTPLAGISTGPTVNQARITSALDQYTGLKAEWTKLQALTDSLNAQGSVAYMSVIGCPEVCSVAAATASAIIAARAAAIGAQLASLGTTLVAAGNTLP